MQSTLLLTPEASPEGRKRACKRVLDSDSGLAEAAGAGTEIFWFKKPFLLGGGANVITDEFGSVLWSSVAADLLMSSDRCVSISDGALCGQTRHSEMVLQSILSAVNSSQRSVEELIAASPKDPPELYLQARPCSVANSTAIAITFRELDRDVDTMPDLRRLFGLTRREQEVVKRMLQGCSVRQIAVEMNKAELTVRTHIKRSYVKLNVRTKEQLFATILKLMVD